MNPARSAFCSVVFKTSSFDFFRVPEGTVQTAVLAKHLLAALRTQRMERIVLSQAPSDRSKIAVELACGRGGMTKTYGVHCVTEAEHLKATIDANAMPVKLVMRPKEFGRLLSHFQSGQTDITISCLPEEEDAGAQVDGFGGGGSHAPARNLKLSSFSDPNAPMGQALQTSVSLDTAEEAILRYDNDTDGAPVDVTVNLKDLKAMVSFCESVDVDVAIFCEHAGAPMLVRPTAEYKSGAFAGGGAGGPGAGRFGDGGGGTGGGEEHYRYFDAAAVDFEAELVLASMLPSDEGATTTATQTASLGKGGDGGAASEVVGGGGHGRGWAGRGVDPTRADSVAGSRQSELTERGVPGGGIARMRRGGDMDLGAGSVGGPAAPSVGIPDSVDGGMSPQPSNASQPVQGGGLAGWDAGGGEGRGVVGAQGARDDVRRRSASAPLVWAPGAPVGADEEDDWPVEESEDFVEATPPGKRRRQ